MPAQPHSRRLPDPATEPTLTIARAAAIAGVSIRHVYVLAQSGELPSTRIGKRIVIPTARFLAYLGLADAPGAVK